MTPRRFLIDWALPMLATLGGLLLAVEFVAAPAAVTGNSMSPGLLHGDRVLVDRWSYRQRRPRPGEVALLRGPGGDLLIKRVALSPDDARETDGIWVTGDNARESSDSRQFGPVGADRFLGRVLWRYWPPFRPSTPPPAR